MQYQGGIPAAFCFKDFNDWASALSAVEAAMPDITAFGAMTFWARHHARTLRCLALEELQRDAQAFLALAEHADASWRLFPKYCDANSQIQKRLNVVRKRLPAAL